MLVWNGLRPLRRERLHFSCLSVVLLTVAACGSSDTYALFSSPPPGGKSVATGSGARPADGATSVGSATSTGGTSGDGGGNTAGSASGNGGRNSGGSSAGGKGDAPPLDASTGGSAGTDAAPGGSGRGSVDGGPLDSSTGGQSTSGGATGSGGSPSMGGTTGAGGALTCNQRACGVSCFVAGAVGQTCCKTDGNCGCKPLLGLLPCQ